VGAIVNASKEALLITGQGTSIQVYPVSFYEAGYIQAPFHSALFGKYVSGNLCLPDMSCSLIQQTKVIGIAKPSEIGLQPYNPAYLLVMVVCAFTLSIPIRLRLILTNTKKMSLAELGAMFTDAVRQNPNHYTHKSASDIERLLSKAKTFEHIKKAFSYE
jgi:hypothetical protein